MLKEFRAFVLRGNVVDLAVGVVIGAAFGGIVNSFVTGLITPLTAIFGDAGGLGDLSFAVGSKVVEGRRVPNLFLYGAVLEAILNFVIVAAVVFFFVVKPVNHLMERFKPEPPKDEVATRECPECLSKIPARARRCQFCTAQISPIEPAPG